MKTRQEKRRTTRGSKVFGDPGVSVELPLFNQDDLRRRIAITLSMNQVVQHIWPAIRFENTEALEPVFDSEHAIRCTRDSGEEGSHNRCYGCVSRCRDVLRSEGDRSKTTPTHETPMERAHRLCEARGLDDAEIDQLIDDTGHSRLDRNALIALWEATYSDPEALGQARELCMPCVEAVLDAAGESARP